MVNHRYFIPKFSIALLALGFSLGTTGCEEDLSSTDEPVMQASVNGDTWSAGDNVDGTIFSTLKTITGTAGDGSSITLSLTNVTSTGSIDVDGGNVEATYIVGAKAYNATSGTINITELDEQGNIEGNFEFDGKAGANDSVAVTNGTFSATLR